MSMDGLSLYAAATELSPLVGGKIDKVQQPEKDLLLIKVRGSGATYRLLLCAHPENGRVQLTQTEYENPENAPAFCMLLRRRLTGGRIAAIRQERLERVLHIEITARDELRDDVTLTLVLELLGKQANLLLLDEEHRIIDCTRRVSAGETASRILLPGFPYEPAAPQEKLNPLTASVTELLPLYSDRTLPAQAFCAQFCGVSKASASALLSACPDAQSLCALLTRLREGIIEPAITRDGNGVPLNVFPFHPVSVSMTPCASMSAAFDEFYASRDRYVRMQRHSGTLRRVAEQAQKRALHKQSAYFEAIKDEDALARDRLCGEWVLASLSRIRPGDTQVVVDNYYADPPQKELVALDPKLSANENAQRYFKRYKKGKAARAYAEKQLAAVSAEIDYLESVLQAIGNCDTVSELNEIRDELIREQYIRPERSEKRKPAHAASRPMEFASSDGLTILVGKNNRQNDELTLKTAGPHDLFFHVKNMPGSHVILLSGGEPPEQSLLEAAMLAAYYSSARGSASVPVDYTPRRYVKKPSGARPGLVIYSTNRTLYVTPTPALPGKLKR